MVTFGIFGLRKSQWSLVGIITLMRNMTGSKSDVDARIVMKVSCSIAKSVADNTGSKSDADVMCVF